MRTNSVRLAGAVAVTLMLSGAPARSQWVNSLKPEGAPAAQVRLVKAGKPRGAIHLAASPTLQERKAAAELQHWISEITGATVPISSGKPGRNSLQISTDASLGRDGYSITGNRAGVMLSGGTGRGAVNAVYALLEEDLGCRFYTRDSVRLPKTNTLVLTPVGRRYAPQLRIRDPFYACAFDAVWSLRNRTDAPSAPVPEEYGGHGDYDGMFVHTAAQLVPPDKYYKEHPEYFAQRPDGSRTTAQLCPTEPGVAKIAIDYVRQTLKANPHTEILSVSKNDNTEICHCERCDKLRAQEGSDMANQLVLVNRVAEAIEPEFPGVAVDTLAYLETIQVPKTIRPRKNVVIRLCNDSVGAWARPFTPAERCDVAKLVGAWSAVHPRIYIWDYNVNFSHYLAPMPNLDVMAANIRFWVRNRAEGVMLQGGYQGPAERDELKAWVMAKLLWDPHWDENALAEDFVWGHYGKAAPAMAEYERLLQNAKMEHAAAMNAPPGGIRYPMDAPFLTKEFVSRAVQILGRARQLSGGDEMLTRRVERAQLPILYVQCARGPEFVDASYAQVVAEFERIAGAEKIRFLQEGGPDFEGKLAGYKAQIRQN